MKKYLGLVIFLAFFWVHSAEAATRTFVGDGASHNWSATGAWVEGQVPTAADDVVFSTNTAGSILVIDGTSGSPSLCRSIDTTNYTRTITFGANKQLNVGTSTSGAFKMTAGMTFVPNFSSLVKFVSTTTGNNITTAGYGFGGITFDGVGGGWQFQDTVNGTANGAYLTLTNGALDTNNQTVSYAFSSSNSNTRSLTLGTTNWSIGNINQTNWDITTATGMTLSAASSTITNTATSVTSSVFVGGGLTYGTLTSTALTTGTLTIAGANTFGTLTLNNASATPTTATGYKFSANQTVTGTFTSTGNALTTRNFLYSDTVGTARTISAGTFAITNTDLRDITKAGAGSGDISATSATTGNGDCGGNTGWTFQAPRNVYMKTAVSVNWSANNWKTTSGGSTAAVPPLPLCHDTNAIFDANSITAGTVTVTIDQPRISGFNWTGVTNTPTFNGTTTWESYGSGILSAAGGMTPSFNANSFMGRGNYSLFTPNNIVDYFQTTINAPTGTYTLTGNLNLSSGGTAFLTVTSGTLALNGNNIISTGAITVNGGTVSGTGTITGTSYTQSSGSNTLGGTLTLTSTFALSGGTLNMNSNQITGHTTATISSTGTLNLSGQLNGSGAISVTGGTITDAGASGELKGTTLAFSGGTSALRKATMTSTIAISGTAATAFNPGTFTHVGNLSVASAGSPTFTINGTAVDTAGVMTVTAAAAAATTGYAWSQ